MQPYSQGARSASPDDGSLVPALETVYQQLTILVRRARELTLAAHPGLSLVAYTVLRHVQDEPEVRSLDLAAHFRLDKSTVSRQVERLVTAGLLVRRGERRGRRGVVLELTPAGEALLDEAAQSLRSALAERIGGWPADDVATFAHYLTRFNDTSPLA